MNQKVNLPYCSHYLPGEQLHLTWLKAITTNDRFSARRLDWHTHDELELIFPIQGHYRYEFKKKHPICASNGYFLIIPGGTSHRLDEAIDPPGFRLHLYLRAATSRSFHDGAFTAAEYTRVYQSLQKMALRRIPVPPRLKATIALLGKIIRQSAHGFSDSNCLRARFLCDLVICECADGNAATNSRSSSQTFAEAIRWLEQNFATSIHLDRLVEHIGYSRAQFFTLFRQQTGLTPGEYLRNYRLGKAKELLLNSNFPAAHIGKICGLGAPAHFTRLFSKMTGLTPLTYRRQKRSRS